MGKLWDSLIIKRQVVRNNIPEISRSPSEGPDQSLEYHTARARATESDNSIINDTIAAEIFGGCSITWKAEPETLTFDKLKALFDYFKSEKITVAGEEHEIWGWKVITDPIAAPYFVFLVEKLHPETARQRGLPRMVMFEIKTGKGWIYDPNKADGQNRIEYQLWQKHGEKW